MKLAVWLMILSLSTSLALGNETNLYVVDIGPNRGQPWQILKYDENGQNPLIFTTQGLNSPQDILFLESEGTALISNHGTGRINRHDATTGALINAFATGIVEPTRIKIGTDNLLYVLQWAGNGKVRRYDLAGNFVDEFTNVGVSNSIGLDWDSQGNLYVASFDGGYVRKFDTNGDDLGLFISTGLQGPTNIWFDSNGDLLVLDWSGGAIRRFSSTGTFLSNFAVGLNQPEGIEFLDNGDILVANGGTSSVRQYNKNGDYLNDLVSPGLGDLATPNGLRLRTTSNIEINSGINDAWYNPATNGQGFLITVFPEIKQVFLAWFTYDTARPPEDVTAILGEPGHRWLTAQGPYDGDTANLKVFVTSGGVFDAAEPAAETDPDGVGTIKIEFANCSAGLLSYEITSLGISGEIPIERIVGDNAVLCEAFDTQ